MFNEAEWKTGAPSIPISRPAEYASYPQATDPPSPVELTHRLVTVPTINNSVTEPSVAGALTQLLAALSCINRPPSGTKPITPTASHLSLIQDILHDPDYYKPITEDKFGTGFRIVNEGIQFIQVPYNESGTPRSIFSNIAPPLYKILPRAFAAKKNALDGFFWRIMTERQKMIYKGHSIIEALGPPDFALNALLDRKTSFRSHSFTRYFIDMAGTFPDFSAIPLGIASAYFSFLLMRWLVYPTQENYERIPEYLRPRTCQLLIPHSMSLEFLIW